MYKKRAITIPAEYKLRPKKQKKTASCINITNLLKLKPVEKLASFVEDDFRKEFARRIVRIIEKIPVKKQEDFDYFINNLNLITRYASRKTDPKTFIIDNLYRLQELKEKAPQFLEALSIFETCITLSEYTPLEKIALNEMQKYIKQKKITVEEIDWLEVFLKSNNPKYRLPILYSLLKTRNLRISQALWAPYKTLLEYTEYNIRKKRSNYSIVQLLDTFWEYMISVEFHPDQIGAKLEMKALRFDSKEKEELENALDAIRDTYGTQIKIIRLGRTIEEEHSINLALIRILEKRLADLKTLENITALKEWAQTLPLLHKLFVKTKKDPTLDENWDINFEYG